MVRIKERRKFNWLILVLLLMICANHFIQNNINSCRKYVEKGQFYCENQISKNDVH